MSDEEWLYKMKLHEEVKIWDGIFVVRVPGGWIYRSDSEVSEGRYSTSQVFVPLNHEFLRHGKCVIK